MTKTPMLSIVVPCYNEESCLVELHDRLAAAARLVAPDDYEIILVNDGSNDSSWSMMLDLTKTDKRLTAINLSRNHGHQMALTAGLDLCRGDLILVVDADLQDPPELVEPMLATMKAEEADVVYGVRYSREGETLFKKWTAATFYRILANASDTAIPLDTGDFRLMTRRALSVFLAMPEQSRFVRGMVAWAGFRQVPYRYERAERYAGGSKYPLSKMVSFALDALTGFSSAPLKLASHATLWLTGGTIALMIYIIFGWLSGQAIQGWTSLMLVVVMLGAIQMFVLSMIGEYLGRLYSQAKQRPLYIVQDVVGGAVSEARLGLNVAQPRSDPERA